MAKDSPATLYFQKQSAHRADVRTKWRADAGLLLDAHELAFSAAVQLIERYAGKRFGKQSASLEGRMSLTAQFIQGVDICEVAIAEGLYSQAAALLKQEMETIEAIHEFETGKRRDRKTPQISRLKELGRVYGQFNEFAHVSVADIAKTVVLYEKGDVCGPAIVPIYDKELAASFYGIHTYFITVIAGQVSSIFEEIFGQGLNDEELKLLFLALQILQKEQIIAPAAP